MEANKIIEQARVLLASGNPSKIREAIEIVNDRALHDLLPDLAVLYSRTTETEIRLELLNIFNNLKHQKSVPMLTEMVRSEKNENTLLMLVSACWQCGLNFSKHMEVFVPLLRHNDFTLAFEACTVIESNIDWMNPGEREALTRMLKEIQPEVKEEMHLLFEGLYDRLLDLPGSED